MKTTVGIFVLLAVCSSLAFGAISQGYYKDPKHPGKCVIKKDLILSQGETIKDPNEDCAKISCEEDSLAIFESCLLPYIPPLCKQHGYINKNRPFPDCCEPLIACA